MIDNNNFLLEVCNISIQAGLIINKYYKQKNKIINKQDNSPLTTADIESNKFIIKSLTALSPNFPILSEEKFIDWDIRKKWNKYWLIDPLDGTKEFIKESDEFTVNIALIANNEPILGVIYAPQLFKLYYANKHKGSFKIDCDKQISSLSKSIKINTREKKSSDKYFIYGSKSHSNNKFMDWVNLNFKDYELIKKGSSIKFCELAEGKADIYPRFGPTSEWDIAAGHIILNEAGGEIKSIDNEKILYNMRDSVINPPFIASSKYIENV